MIEKKSNELPHPAVAKVQTDNPTPISLNGLWLQGEKDIKNRKLNHLKDNPKNK